MMHSNTFVTKYTAVNIGNYVCIYIIYITPIIFKKRLTCYFGFIRRVTVEIIAANVISLIMSTIGESCTMTIMSYNKYNILYLRATYI